MSAYKNFTEYDFLHDDRFIEWMLTPSDESDEYWKNVVESSPQLASVIGKARILFRNSVRLSDHRETDSVIDSYISELSVRIKIKNQSAARRRRLISGITGAACAAIFAFALIFQPGKKDDYILSIRHEVTTDTVWTGEVTLLNQNTAVTIDNNSEIVLNDLLSAITQTTDESVKNKSTVSTVHLIVPRERQTSIRLDDGSVIWVNAGSKVSFPEKFSPTSREISVDGEVYLSVTKDTSRPFTVNVGELKVRVLGTEFGITAYSNENVKSVVLVSGSVEVCRPGADPVRLRPNQCMETFSDRYSVGTVDVMEHVSWKNGWIYANGTNLCDLMSKLSRYYGRSFVCDPAVANLTCSGKLLFSDDMEIILQVICKNTGVKYLISENEILLYP